MELRDSESVEHRARVARRNNRWRPKNSKGRDTGEGSIEVGAPDFPLNVGMHIED